MISFVLKPYTLALFLGLIAAGLIPGQLQAEESNLYKIGRAAAYASHCGHRDLVLELQARYGDYRDFRTGRQKNDLQRYDYVRLACGKLKKNLEEFLEEERANDAPNSVSNVPLSDEDKQAALERIYTDIMTSILAKDAMWDSDTRGRLLEPISAYRSTVVHGRKHKSLAACLRWDAKKASLSYLIWRAEIHRSWTEAKYFALVECRKLRARKDLKCGCRSVDHNDENVLSLADYILSGYEHLVDAEASSEDEQVGSSN